MTLKKYQRIISLVPSQTELLYSLGLGDAVVGITKFCVHPPEWFSTKTRIGGTKNIDIEKIKSLQPDLIIANKEENVKEQVELLSQYFPVYVSDVNDLPSALQMIDDIGRQTNTREEAAHIIAAISKEFASLAYTETLRCCYLIWKDPYMTIGGDTFISDMLKYANCKNVSGHLLRYPEISINDITQANCDLIFLSSEPYPFKEKHAKELQEQTGVRRVMLVDGEMFSWYGSRLLHAPAYFREILKSY